MTNPPSIAIIGGGLSGLYAAYLLHQKAIPFTVYEARNRLGGRINTHAVPQQSHHQYQRYDLGPTWFWPEMHPHMQQLISQLSLTAFPQYHQGSYLFDRGHHQPPQHYPAGMTTSPVAMRLAGGLSSLIDALQLPLPKQSLYYQHRLSRLTQQDNGKITVTFITADGTIDLSYDKVIIAIPPALFNQDVTVSPSLSPHCQQYCEHTPTWMAAHAKFIAIYSSPFWRESGLSGSASSQVGPLAEIHDAGAYQGMAALFGFFGINAAARKTAGHQALTNTALEQLARLFGEAARQPVDTAIMDWSQESMTASKRDLYPPTQHPHYGLSDKEVSQWQQRLFFAGSETDTTAGGYLEGALNAALRVVKHLSNTDDC